VTLGGGGGAGSRRYVADLGPAERVYGVYSIINAQLGQTKTGKPFLKCLIGDKSGTITARMWSIDPAHFRALPTDGFVYIDGETQPYQGELQLILQSVDAHEPSGDQLRELIPSSRHDPEAMFAEVKKLLETLSHPAARALAQVYLADEHLMSAFKQAPAAKSMHHAYLGGLLEHTLSLMKAADCLAPNYPKLNRDIVLLGLFLHDLGKTRELVYDRTFSYSDRGELIGHIVDGAIMLHDRAQQVMRTTGLRLPPNLVLVLQHIILSHHGQPEFGAAKIPMTPEAIFVHALDNLDAKLAVALSAARPDSASVDVADQKGAALGGNFTEKQWALDTKIFRPDPLAE
jgi:3'-5' exoribonuclease